MTWHDIKGRLTDKQRRMIDHYFGKAKFNKTDAARRAGYKLPSDAIGRLFGYKHVKEEVARRHKKLTEKSEVSIEWIVERYKAIAGFDLMDIIEIQPDGSGIVDLRKLTPDHGAVMDAIQVEEYTEGRGPDARNVKRVKVTPRNALAALNALAKFKGMFKDQVELTGSKSLVELLQAGRDRVREAEEAKDKGTK